jgi:hypothetical protein
MGSPGRLAGSGAACEAASAARSQSAPGDRGWLVVRRSGAGTPAGTEQAVMSGRDRQAATTALALRSDLCAIPTPYGHPQHTRGPTGTGPRPVISDVGGP